MKYSNGLRRIVASHRSAPAAAACAVAIAVYALGLRWYESITGMPGAKAVTVPATAIGMLLGALALSLLNRPDDRRRRWGRVAAASTVMLGAASLVAVVLAAWKGVDVMQIRWWCRPSSAMTGAALLLLGAAELRLHVRPRRWATVLATGAFGISLAAGIGHLYDAAGLYGLSRSGGMAITTALGLGVLSLGVLFCDPSRGMAALYLSDHGGGRVLRRLGPTVVGGPVLLGWVLLSAAQQRVVTLTYGTAFLVVALIVFLAGVLVRTAKVLNRFDRELAASLQHEQQARAAAEARRLELERINESRAKLIRGFSHDVKNPLGVASSQAWLVSRRLDTDVASPEVVQGLARIERSIRSAVALIDELLDVAMAEAADIPLHPVPTALGDLVRDIAASYAPQAAAKGLTLKVADGADVRLTTDPARAAQVVSNLLSNAVKYTPTGSVTVDVRVDTSESLRDGSWARVDVCDTGAGIPDDEKARVFVEYTRLDPNSTAGAGIGLAISRQIARRLGGDITLDDRTGGGAWFTFWLPMDAGVLDERRAGEGTGQAPT